MKVAIDFDSRVNKFYISSPPWEVSRTRAIPNRRWDSKRRVWVAPSLRANVEYLTRAFPAECFTASAAAEVVRSRAVREIKTIRFPSAYQFKIEPMPHQRSGMDRVYGINNFALFMQPRTGKTKIAVDIGAARNLSGLVDMMVVACPNSLKYNWSIEVEKNSMVEPDVHILDSGRKKKFEDWLSEPHPFKVLIFSLEGLSQGSTRILVAQALARAKTPYMVVDESHFIKKHSSIRSQHCVDLGKLAKYRAILTGTPTSNTLMDYFMQFEFLDPDIIGIGDFYSFRNRYAVMGGYDNKEIIGYQNEGELMELIAPHIYQVMRSDVFHDLPPKEYEVRVVALSKQQKELYESLRRKKKAMANGVGTEVQNALTLMGRLQEITAGIFSYDNPDFDDLLDKRKYIGSWIEGGSPKIVELMSIVESEPGSIIIWTRFDLEAEAVVAALVEKYGREAVVELNGKIDIATRDHNVRGLFQTGKARFLVANAATGGVGHEMSKAETMVYMSNTFSYVERVQSEDRASSVAQKNVVKVIDIMCEGTVDELVMEALVRKQDLAEYVSDSIRSIIDRI